MTNQLIKLFEKYEKQKKLNEFYQYIEENGLKDKFIDELFLETFRVDPKKDYTSLINCAMVVAKESFTPVLGQKTSNRLLGLIQESPHPNMQVMYLRQLRGWSKIQEPDVQQGVLVDKILDIFSQEGMTLGIHKIGTNIGDTLKQEGIILSGHKFASKDSAQENINNNMKNALSENITFVQNPLEALTDIISNRGYNNYGRGGSNDIMVVAIPTNELEANNQNIILHNEDKKHLNPQYIQGYIRIDVEKGTLQDVNVDRDIQTTNKSYDIENTLKRFSEQTTTSKFVEAKRKVASLFKQLVKPKQKETKKERD